MDTHAEEIGLPRRYLKKMKADGRMGSHYKRGMALLAVLIMAVSSLSIWNALMLQQAIDARTMAYVQDVSALWRVCAAGRVCRS